MGEGGSEGGGGDESVALNRHRYCLLLWFVFDFIYIFFFFLSSVLSGRHCVFLTAHSSVQHTALVLYHSVCCHKQHIATFEAINTGV